MSEPLTALVIGTSALGLAVYFFWPGSGILARWQRTIRDRQRVLLEDALKHIYHCEYRKVHCTTQSVSGALSIDGDAATRLLILLEKTGLLESRENVYKLTSEGRSYALRIIRVHRLWERYLADRTGVHETEWHRQAEKLEHRISPDEADALAAKMGNPTFDPHGDPIPTPTGQIPNRKGVALNEFGVNQMAQIVHLEDEPDTVYAQLVAFGLHPGMEIRVLESTKERIRFEAGGDEVLLAPIAAANVTVTPLPDDHEMEGPFKSLANLKPGESGEVVRISGACRGLQRRRLMDLGVIPGTVIASEMESVNGDPVAYRIRGAAVALRREQAKLVFIKEQPEETNGK